MWKAPTNGSAALGLGCSGVVIIKGQVTFVLCFMPGLGTQSFLLMPAGCSVTPYS